MTNLIKFCPTGRNGGASPPIDAIKYHFEPNLGAIGAIWAMISWSRPRSKFMKYFAVYLKKVLDKKVKS